MIKPVIDYINPILQATCLMLMFVTAYGGDWIGAATFLALARTDQWLTEQREKALPKRSFL